MTIASSWRTRALATVATFAIFAAFAQQPEVGRDYYALPQAQPVESDGKIEVVEFFHYGCGHCAALEPRLESWARSLPPDVRLTRIPTNYRLMGIDAPQVFYTLQALGQLDKLHAKVFDAAHKENKTLGNTKVLEGWLKEQGVDPVKYQEVAKSFSMSSRYGRAVQLQNQFKIESVPTLVVGGKYIIKNAEGTLNVADYLIAQLRREAAAAAPAAAPAAKK